MGFLIVSGEMRVKSPLYLQLWWLNNEIELPVWNLTREQWFFRMYSIHNRDRLSGCVPSKEPLIPAVDTADAAEDDTHCCRSARYGSADVAWFWERVRLRLVAGSAVWYFLCAEVCVRGVRWRVGLLQHSPHRDEKWTKWTANHDPKMISIWEMRSGKKNKVNHYLS